MLCQFTVKNFQCIKDEMTLDMQATGITENEESVLTDIDGEKFLPLAAIYGPNGSGKSTVLFALYSLACKIMRPICAISSFEKGCVRDSHNMPITPFKFAKETAEAPTEYELFFRTHTHEYQYKLSVLKNKVISEELSRKNLEGKRYSPVFAREGTGKITLKGSVRSYGVSDIPEELTLLSYFGITHGRNTVIKDIVNWFDNGFQFIDYSDPKQDMNIVLTEGDDGKALVLKMLAEMDIDISDYRTEEKDDRIRVFTTHTVSGEAYELDFTDESNGTIKIFGLLPYIADSLTRGTALLVDELDAKLHPRLLEYIIGLFRNPKINKKHSQLIFTSHDLSTMTKDNFRRDEIWFIARGENSGARLYSLVEFKGEDGRGERKDAVYNKRYLEGRYGADPYLKKIIDWEVL